jgi:aminoglycoside/choline kinase family phosphotransferase
MPEPRIERALVDLYGAPPPTVELVKLRGDASTRSYYRASIEGAESSLPTSVIIMQLPEDGFGSDEGGTQPQTARLPFLEVAELLSSRGLPTPTVYATDLESGVVLLEDLGDVTLHEALESTPASEWPDLYARAVDLLAELHERCETLPEASIVSQRRFDRELLDWELDHFREWGLEALFGELPSADRATLQESFERIADAIEEMPCGFVHRDYQSKNLMVRPNGALAVIDFQDALVGPRVYDLVALLCDSYVALDVALQESMIDRYAAVRHIERTALHREFWWVTLHRKLKDAGRFVFIDRVRGNPDFLQWFPQSLVYVGRAADRVAEMRPLGVLLRSLIPGFPDAVSKPASSME